MVLMKKEEQVYNINNITGNIKNISNKNHINKKINFTII
jgi:hypothetical protein